MFTKKMRILLTEKCNANCQNCFNANYRKNNEMGLEDLEKMSIYFRNKGIETIKIMGGEPTMHSNYLDAIKILQKYFKKISIFSNAISKKIYDTELRAYDSVIYNFNFLDKNNILNKLMLNKMGFRTLEIQINDRINIDAAIETLEIIRYEKQLHKVGVNLTLDCMEKEKKNLILASKKWRKFEEYLYNDFRRPVNIDHAIPICIKNKMKINTGGSSLCKLSCAGLIDTDFNLLFCNQFPQKIGKLWDENGNFISEINMSKIYEKFFNLKQNININKNCSKCKHFKVLCNGGCFQHKIN